VPKEATDAGARLPFEAAETGSVSPMTAPLPEDTLRPGTAAEAARLRAALHDAGFVSEVAGGPQQLHAGSTKRNGAWQLAEGLDPTSPLVTLLTMWQLGQPVAADAAAAAFRLDSTRLIELGLIRHAGEGTVAAEVVIAVHDGLWFASDSTLIRATLPMADNFVMPITGSSLALAGCIPADHAGTVLDLGTGNGILAVAASRHAGRVVGTDVNRRALSMARFNAWLNDATNVEFREGSLYDPVAGEQFDLVMANPPFVVSPDAGALFRDGRGGADEMSRDVVSQAGRVLRPGGLAFVMVNWGVREGEQVFDRLRSWVEGRGVDAVAIANATDDGETYARRWLEMNDKSASPADIERWTQHYQALAIRAIGTGVIVLRRQHGDEGTPWFANFAAPLIKTRKKADHFAQLFALQDFLHGLAGDEADPQPLLCRVLRPAEGHELYRTYVYRDGAYQACEARARIGVGFPFAGSLEVGVAELLSRCDRGRPLAELLSELAVERGIEPSEMVAGALPSVRKMVALGLLLPPEVPDLPAD
jgi:SAM-dependent methyltransferase